MNYFTKEQLEDITNSILSNPVVETLKELYDKYSDKNEEVVEEPINNIENTEVQELKQEGEELEVSNPSIIDTPVEVPMPNEERNNVMTSEPLENTINIPILGENENKMISPEEPVASPIPSVVNIPTMEPIPNAIEAPAVNPIPNVPVEGSDVEAIPNFVNNVPNTEVPVQGPSFEIPSFSAPEVNVPNTNNNLNINSTPFNSPVFGGNLWETPTNGVNNLMQTTDNFNTPEENKAEEAKPEVNVPFFGGPAEAVNNPIPVQEKPQNYGPTMFGQFEQNYRG